MAKHKYDGKWRYFENPDGGQNKFTKGKDMKLAIPREDGKVDKANSSHDGKEVRGDARDDGVTLFRGPEDDMRTFHGTTMFEIPLTSGDVFAVIKGRFIDDDDEDRAEDDGQHQGDWVITKP